MQLPDGLDDLFSTEWVRDVDDDEVRIYPAPCILGRPRRGLHEHGITRLAQPTFEQAKNLVVGFDNQDALLLLHHDISDYRSVTNV